MRLEGEQLVIGKAKKRIEEDHLARYKFTKDYVESKIVLDIACGTGYGSKIIKKYGAKEVYGVDISKEAIGYAKHNYKGSNINFRQSSASDLEFNNDFFDVIVSFETIEHLDKNTRNNYLKELFRTIKPNGTIIISTPNRKITSPNSKKPINEFHYLEYNQKEFFKLINDYNFKIINIYGQRIVFKLFNFYLIRKLIIMVERIFKYNFNIYNIANGPLVQKYNKFYEPRYFVLIIKVNK